MQADGTLVKLSRIHNAVHRISRIDRTWMGDIHLDNVERFEAALPGAEILMHEMKILHVQAAERHRHPAILIAMIVYRARLTYFPTDCHQFIERRAVDQIPRVMLAIPVQVGHHRVDVHWSLFQEVPDGLSRKERSLRQFAQFLDERLDGNRSG